MRKLIEKLLYQGSKTGFALTTTAMRTLTPAKKPDSAQRLGQASGRGLFDLSPTEEQVMVQDNLQRFAREVLRPAAHQADHDHRTPDDIKQQAQELGLMHYAVPEAFGGMAAEKNTVTQMLALEALAQGDFSLAAALYTGVSVANVLTRYGSADQQARYLPALLEGMPATLACTESTPAADPMLPLTTAIRSGDHYTLNGEKALVLMGDDAELFIVSALLDGKPSLFLVEGGTDGLSRTADPAMGLKAAQTQVLSLKNVTVPLDNHIANADFREFMDLGSLALCALAAGTGDAVLDYVIPYVNEREAFGEPISNRQGVAFMVADMAIERDAMRMLTSRAAALDENSKPFHREAHLARVLSTDKAMKLGTDAVQLLGGHGYTKEHPVERWYRDLRSLSALHGALCL